MLSKHERDYGWGMDAGQLKRNPHSVVLCSRTSFLFSSQVRQPVSLHGQLNGVCLHPLCRPRASYGTVRAEAQRSAAHARCKIKGTVGDFMHKNPEAREKPDLLRPPVILDVFFIENAQKYCACQYGSTSTPPHFCAFTRDWREKQRTESRNCT